MKFVLTKEHVYPWPVTVNPPDPERPGELLEQKFVMTFRAMPRDEADAFDAQIDALPDAEKLKHQDDLLRSVAKGWDENVVGEDKKPIPFSPEMLEQAMLHSWFKIGCYRAYRESLRGQAAAKGN